MNLIRKKREYKLYKCRTFLYINKFNKDRFRNITFLYLSPDNKYLFSGYFNGFIEIFAISDSQSEISTQVISSMNKINVSQNNNKLIGLGYNPITNYIYTSCNKENKIGVSFIDSKNMINNIIGGDYSLAGFSYLCKNNYLNH